ncbi:MAG: acetyl-CoA carboxylase biotin carboxyl carrier protein subunit [Thermoanaerobaculia bacterium]
MQLVARFAGRSERLEVTRLHSGHYRVRIAERELDVDTRSLGPFVISLLVEGESHETAVFRHGDGSYAVGWRGRSFDVELVDPLTHLAEEARGGPGQRGKMTVTAYMPGRVVDIRVAEGEAVEAGQSLVVLEAMKMQNEIQADRAGTVKKIHVTSGEAVEGGDPLLEIE